MLELLVIKTKEKVFVSINEKPLYNHINLMKLKINGEHPEPTHKNNWFEIKDVPMTVEKPIPPKSINNRWELREGFPITQQTPQTLEYKCSEDNYVCSSDCFPVEYAKFEPLYEHCYDRTEETFEPIEFKLNVIAELDTFKIVKKQFEPKYNLLDEINTHPVLLPTKPCKLSSEDSYKIIRKYVKENIDKKVAKITSDYDFCFTVAKVIELCEPEAYKYDVGTGKKPKYETRYRKTRDIVVYKTAPDRKREGVYGEYPRTPEFKGKSYEDMEKNIDEFLKNLMEEINRPLKDCPHCKGMGVVEVNS